MATKKKKRPAAKSGAPASLGRRVAELEQEMKTLSGQLDNMAKFVAQFISFGVAQQLQTHLAENPGDWEKIEAAMAASPVGAPAAPQ